MELDELKDKAIREMRQENETLQKANADLSAALTKATSDLAAYEKQFDKKEVQEAVEFFTSRKGNGWNWSDHGNLVAAALRSERAAKEKAEASNKILEKQWGEIKYAYDHAKINSRWHEERHGQAESNLWDTEGKLWSAEEKLSEFAAALAKKDEALRETWCASLDDDHAIGDLWANPKCGTCADARQALSLNPCPEVLEAVRREDRDKLTAMTEYARMAREALIRAQGEFDCHWGTVYRTFAIRRAAAHEAWRRVGDFLDIPFPGDDKQQEGGA